MAVLFFCGLRIRPTCCIYNPIDLVFRSKIAQATSGISVPSETIMHEHKTWTEPLAKPCIASSLSFSFILPSTTAALYPAFLNFSQVIFA